MTRLADLPLPDWHRAGGPPDVRAGLRRSPADFRVTERLDIDFSGEGEHDWLMLQKTGANTAWVARQLARFADVPVRDVGYSGQKDRHAITCQWFSVRRGKDATHRWDDLALAGVEVLRTERHGRKLRIGTHRINAFDITLTDCSGSLAGSLERVARDGVPNYFGEQRFGREGRNLALADALFAGRRLKRDQRSMALSSARAFLFNAVLDARVREGNWHQLVDGDVAMLAGSGSHFAIDAVDAELEARCAAFDIHPSAPLWGKGSAATSPLEEAVVAAHRALADALTRHVDGQRRATRLQVHGLRWETDGSDTRLSFELERGAFATAVLREVVSYTDLAASSAAP